MPDFPKIGGATAAEVAAAILVDPGTDKIDGSQIDASVASRAVESTVAKDSTVAKEAGNVATVMGKTNLIGASVALETAGNLAAVKTKTDLIPADIATQLDTNVPAIKGKTDIIGASVALESGGAIAAVQTKANKIQDFLEEGTGTLTATGAEDTVRIYTGTGKLHCYIDLFNMVAGNSVTIRQYMTIKTAGTYRLYAQETYADAQTLPLLHIVAKPGKFGVKITLQQAAVVYKTYDWETLVEQAAA